MHSIRRLFRPRASGSWRLFVCLIATALLCRALIPAGYMPGRADDSVGKLLALTLCTADGPVSGIDALLHDTSQDDTQHDAPPGTGCPFGLLASHAVLPDLSLSVVTAWTAFMQAERPVYRSIPVQPITGPPVGSRAPPFHLA